MPAADPVIRLAPDPVTSPPPADSVIGLAPTPPPVDPVIRPEIPAPLLAPRVKLPKLVIQKFWGEVTKWLPFWNQVEMAIDNNPQLNYLHSFLESKAADAVRGMALTAANYPEAVAKLIWQHPSHC